MMMSGLSRRPTPKKLEFWGKLDDFFSRYCSMSGEHPIRKGISEAQRYYKTYEQRMRLAGLQIAHIVAAAALLCWSQRQLSAAL